MHRKPVQEPVRSIRCEALPDKFRAIVIAFWKREGIIAESVLERMVAVMLDVLSQPSDAQTVSRPE